ncbi:MAG: DUF1080 domain-containing protein [Chitinophagaceae bacterium]
MKNVSWIFSLVITMHTCFAQKQEWKSLFNGKDLTGWDTYLRAPNLSGYGVDSTLPYMAPIGLNNDPLNVFTVENGAVRVTGQIWGAITSKEEYGNFHIRFQTKWGKLQWKPRDTGLRDAGFLFYCTGPLDYGFKCWMRSLEMQIQETEIGDFFNVGAGESEFQLSPAKTGSGDSVVQYDPGAPLKRHKGRVYRSGNFESAPGEWTTSEAIVRMADAVFIVNGFVVNRLYNTYRMDLQQQTLQGKLQFQSEGAEIYYRKMEIRPISFTLATPKLIANQQTLSLAPGQSQHIEILNQGDAVEIIAAELIGKQIEDVIVNLPSLPMVLKKGARLSLPVALKPGARPGNKIKFRLETVLGPVPDFVVELESNN